MTFAARLRKLIPSRQQLAENRWLHWLSPWFKRPELWHWSRRGVAIGVAIGLFFGLLFPVAQIPLSAIAAIALRANLPAAAASTLITNPVTAAPIYYGAYKVGVWVTGSEIPLADASQAEIDSTSPEQGLLKKLSAVGKPLLIGLAICAIGAGLISYVLIKLVWRWRVMLKRRQHWRQRNARLS